MNLTEYIDKEITVFIPFLGQDLQAVTLRGVEPGGIWVESDSITRSAMGEKVFDQIAVQLGVHSVAVVPIAPVFFFPYHEVRLILAFGPGMTLNDKAFGV